MWQAPKYYTLELRAKRCTARRRPDDQYLQQEVKNRNLQQVRIFRSSRYKTAEYCTQHALGEMVVDVCSRKCRTEGCGKRSSFGVGGTKTGEYCAQHALEGMVNVKNKKCRTKGCGKQSSFGVAGTKTGEYCAQHAPEGMV